MVSVPISTEPVSFGSAAEALRLMLTTMTDTVTAG